MLCCPNCFAHSWLKQRIQEMSTTKGPCDFCCSDDAPVVEVSELCGCFHNLLSMYEVAESFETGEPLIRLVQEHWGVFDDDLLAEDTQVELLEEVANSDWDDDDGESELDARELYSPPGMTLHMTHRDVWDGFCDKVREHPEEPLPFEEFFAEDFAQLAMQVATGTTFYRSRRGFKPDKYYTRLPYSGAELAAPPVEKAFAARANVEGQRVLYCADDEKTAISEARATRGYYVSVATLTLNREIRILDLTKKTEEINPFTKESLKWHVEIGGLLDAFAEEMSRPLERDDDKTHYLPCQKLADFIRGAAYDGIRYPSALNPEGTNVVIFDPGAADVTTSKLAEITEVTFEYEPAEAPAPKEGLNLAARAD
jgi:RES domain-containing protein